MDACLENRLKNFRQEHGYEEDQDSSVYLKVRELILDGSSIKTISMKEGERLEKFKNLSKLSLNGTGLTTLTNFPEMPSLKVLELTDNYISDPIVFTMIPKLFPNLKILQMGGNHLKNPHDVKSLSTMPYLVVLGLAMNPMANEKNYREVVFECLPNLEVLDQVDSTGAEYNYSSDEALDDDLEGDADEDDLEGPDEEDDVLKKFYEAEYKSDDEEDDDEFDPENQPDVEDEDFYEEEDEEEELDEPDDDYDGKRSAEDDLENESASSTKPKTE
uniref:Acidic leucine-rich nuclear phosphoprotein 32 family, putative n=1 Tax=Theileria annulata TaxID=5874 RepID=A0A3B0N0R9_THEAN